MTPSVFRLILLLSLLWPRLILAAGVRFNTPVTIENSVNYFNDAGSTDSYAGSLAGEGFQGGAYIQGTCVTFTANTANTGAATLSINGITPAAIKKMVNGAAVDLANNDICVDQQVRVCYEQTYWQMQSPVCNVPGGAIDFTQITGVATDAQIPDLNTLASGLTTGRCVEVDGSGKLGVAAEACGTGGGGSTGISGASLNAPLYALGGTTATSTAALTNGQLLIGSTGNPPVVAGLTGTASQIRVTGGAGSITLDFPPAGLTLPGTTTLSTPLARASGGTGTGGALTGVVRGGDPLTAAELSGDVTTSGSNAVTIAANAVTLAKMADMTSDRLLGRDTAATGDPEELTVGGGLEFTGTGGLRRSALTGDVTAAAGSTTTTIAPGVVDYSKIQNVSATDRLLGRDAAAPGVIEEITPTNVKIMLGLDQVNNTADASKNVATAAALAVNGANCVTAGTFPNGVSAVGAAENCTALVADPGANGLVNRTSPTASAAITSATVGQVLKVAGPNAFIFGAVDLSDANAVTNALPYANLTLATAASRLLGRGAAAGPGVWQELTLSAPLSMTGTDLSVGNAAADGTTKGAATFAANDFNATAGVISLDYVNGQAATTSLKGFLTSTDWNTFNAKLGLSSPAGGVVHAAAHGVVCDGTTDTTSALQTAVTAAISGTQGLTLVMPKGGTCKLSGTITVASVHGFRLIGNGVVFTWAGANNIPMFLFQDSAEALVEHFKIAVSTGAPILNAIQVENGAASAVGPTKNSFEHLVIECTNGGCTNGIVMEQGAGGDTNNEFNLFKHVVVSNVAAGGACAFIKHGQSKHNVFEDFSCNNNGLGGYIVRTDPRGSFLCTRCHGGNSAIADFHIGGGTETITISDSNFEGSARLLTTAGPSATPTPVTIQNTRWTIGSLHADNRAIVFQFRGPLVLLNNMFEPATEGKALEIHVNNTGVDFVALGNYFASTLADPYTGTDPTVSLGNTIDRNDANGLVRLPQRQRLDTGSTSYTWNVTAATCTGDANGGALTVNASNEIVCSADAGGGGGTPSGSTTQLQYNNAGAFGGSAGATFDADAQLTQRDKCTTISTSTTLGTHLCVYVNTSAGNVTLTMPNASMTNSAADVYKVWKVSSDANQLIVAPNAGDNLNFAASNMTTTLQGEGFHIVEQDGAATGNWLVERALSQVGTAQIADDAVTLAKMADMATDSFLGRDTAGTGNPEVLTAAQARDLIHAAGIVKSVYLSAGSLDVSGSCAVNASAVLLTNGPKLPTIGCTDNDADSIEFDFVMPDGWNAGTVTVELAAFSIGNNNNEVFEMDFAFQCVSSGDTPTAHSTTGEQPATITWGNAANREQHATTAAITGQGTCAAGDHIYFRGQVDATATTLTPMSDLKILGVKIEYTITAQD